MTAATMKTDSTRAMAEFDFAAPAEVFGGSSWSRKAPKMAYRRFGSSAEAIQYVIEELDETARRSCVIEVNEKRFNHLDARKLYERKAYPLPKVKRKDADAT